MAKMAGTQRWWAHQVEVFGLGFVLFISFANLLFGILGEWYAIFLAYLLRSIYMQSISFNLPLPFGLFFGSIHEYTFPGVGTT